MSSQVFPPLRYNKNHLQIGYDTSKKEKQQETIILNALLLLDHDAGTPFPTFTKSDPTRDPNFEPKAVPKPSQLMQLMPSYSQLWRHPTFAWDYV